MTVHKTTLVKKWASVVCEWPLGKAVVPQFIAEMQQGSTAKSGVVRHALPSACFACVQRFSWPPLSLTLLTTQLSLPIERLFASMTASETELTIKRCNSRSSNVVNPKFHNAICRCSPTLQKPDWVASNLPSFCDL